MRPALVSALALASLVAAAGTARAQVPGECRDFYMESRFPAAQECIDEALAEAEGDPTAVAELFAYRAAILVARDLEDEARESMEVVLALIPRWEPSDPLLTSPRITALLDEVRGTFDVSAGQPSLQHEPPGSETVEGEALVVQARAPNVDAPLEAVLMVRSEGERRWRPVQLHGRPGRHLSARVPLDPGERVAYYLAVTTPGGWVALRSGSAEDPFFAERPADEGDGGPGPGPGPGPDGDPGVGRRLWWVWTLVGVVVVGVGVGLGVGLGMSAQEDTGSVRLHFP